jgi:cell division protein FtsB
MRILLAILVVALILLQLKLWLGEGGYREVSQLQQKVEDQAQENRTLEQRNRELQAEVEDLRQGLDAVEERARSELGMIKEGEAFYQVVPESAGLRKPVRKETEQGVEEPVPERE